jgi:hypothetical protein
MRSVTRSVGLGSANRSALELSVLMQVASVSLDAWKAFRDTLKVVAAMVSSGGCILKKKAAGECFPDEEGSAAAWRVVAVELDGVKEGMNALCLDYSDCFDSGPESGEMSSCKRLSAEYNAPGVPSARGGDDVGLFGSFADPERNSEQEHANVNDKNGFG